MVVALLTLVTAMLIFSIVEWRWPSAASAPWWRRPIAVDLSCWLIHPLVIAYSLLVAAWSTSGLIAAVGENAPRLTAVRATVAALPAWLGFVVAFVASDFLSYWVHRAYHRLPLLWKFHVVHHSSEPVDWLSVARLHPLSQAVNTVGIGVVLMMVGLSPAAVATANALGGIIATIAHANLRWSFGPLRLLLVAPLFHRRHHARSDGNHYNYGGALSIWDRCFGTRAPDPDSPPARFGADDAPRATLVSLLLHPLARRAPERS